MTFRFFIIVCFLGGSSNVRAQNVQQPAIDSTKRKTVIINTAPVQEKVKKPKALTKEISVAAGLTTDGWAVSINKGWIRSVDEKESDKFHNVRFAQIEFTEHKHAKEIRGTNNSISQTANEKPKPFIYGKVNNFYALKLGYGNRRMIAGKPESGTVSIHWVYAGGLSIGLLKPYYIDAYVLRDNPRRYARESIKYSDENQEGFIRQENIVGSSGWTKGLGETKIAPGIHAKTGLHFDFAANKKTKLAVEVGLSGELYTQKIELMATQKAYPYLVNGYISLQFGKRK